MLLSSQSHLSHGRKLHHRNSLLPQGKFLTHQTSDSNVLLCVELLYEEIMSFVQLPYCGGHDCHFKSSQDMIVISSALEKPHSQTIVEQNNTAPFNKSTLGKSTEKKNHDRGLFLITSVCEPVIGLHRQNRTENGLLKNCFFAFPALFQRVFCQGCCRNTQTHIGIIHDTMKTSWIIEGNA